MKRARNKSTWLLGVVVSATALPQVQADPRTGDVAPRAAGFEALRAADLQLATIGFRLSTASAPICDRLEPGTGLQLHTLAQYPATSRDRVRAHFGFAGAVAIEGVVPDSPAARAGVQRDDTLVAIDGVPLVPAMSDEASTAPLETLHARLAALAPTAPMTLSLIRAGRPLELRLQPVPACFSRYELRIGNTFDARANGELVQITSRYIEDVDPALLPAVIAHELSHNILHHRDRLKAAGAEFGLASGFGSNVGLFRQTEIEADILAVHLLRRAGYDPRIAARFWRDVGPRLTAGMIRSRSHPPIDDRVAIAELEAARVRAAQDPPPAFWNARKTPLDGNWRRHLPIKAR